MIDKYDQARLLSEILLEYEPISRAPKNIFDVPKEAQLDEAKFQQWRAKERTKRYKTINEAGEIFLIINPFVWDIEKITKWDSEGNSYYETWITRPKPIKYQVEQKTKKKHGSGIDW